LKKSSAAFEALGSLIDKQQFSFAFVELLRCNSSSFCYEKTMIIFYGLGISALALKLFMFELIIFITPKLSFYDLEGLLWWSKVSLRCFS
jgi:hypothetical protein